MSHRSGLISEKFTGTKELDPDPFRSYFYVESEFPFTVELGRAGGLLKRGANGFYEPYVIPTGYIEIIGEGEYTVVTGHGRI